MTAAPPLCDHTMRGVRVGIRVRVRVRVSHSATTMRGVRVRVRVRVRVSHSATTMREVSGLGLGLGLGLATLRPRCERCQGWDRTPHQPVVVVVVVGGAT
jgi:hypothetical protein